MKTYMNYSDWIISQIAFNPDYLGKSEAIFALGNGYMGSRSAEEERYTGEKRDSFVSGTFNTFDANEVTELPNLPDMWAMEFCFNGQALNLLLGKIEDYKKSLNLKNGELTRSFRWKYEDLDLHFDFRRFVSMADRHFMASQVKIKNLSSKSVNVQLKSGINGQGSNEGSQHFTDGEKGLVDGRCVQMMPQTTRSQIDFVLSVEHLLSASATPVQDRPETGRRAFFMNYSFEIPSGQTQTVEKRANVYTSIDNDLTDHSVSELRKVAIEALKTMSEKDFDTLLEASAQAWKIIWEKHPIKITSPAPKDMLAVRFAKFHLHSMVPAHDVRMNIGAKGLSGEGYKGHTFWDTEIFMLPYFTFTHPEIAKSLVTYRYLGLEGAHKKAAANGYQGAQYPWEAAWPTDGEATPVWGAADIITGQPTKIWSGFIEQHITSDVAFGIKQYLDVTGDEDFAREMGYEILIDTAKFWMSRLEYNADQDIFEINDVIGPDEYKEHVDNNAYTNYTAHWNVSYVIGLIDDLADKEKDTFDQLDQKFSLRMLQKDLIEKCPKIFLPEPTASGIIPQDDSYLGKTVLDLSRYKKKDSVGELFHDYNLEQVNGMQISKQADVLLLLLLFEGLFDKELKLMNFDYYEPNTTHDSSLSLSTHAILSADLGKVDLSYEFFRKAVAIDMGEYMKSSDDGIHAASLGGIWQMTVLGYGGVRIIDGKLRIEPHLPKDWEELSFGFDYQGKSVTVNVTQADFTVTADDHQEIIFVYRGEAITLDNKITLSL